MRTKESYVKRNISPHGQTDRKNSWYWSVLLKNLGTIRKAEKAIQQSRIRTDPTYWGQTKIKY